MRWTSRDEKEILKEWSKEYTSEAVEKDFFMLDEKKSYWDVFDNDDNIIEYSFDTVPELKAFLKNLLDDNVMQEILVPCTVAAFKGKAELDKMSTENIDENDFQLPEFIYVF